MATGEVRAKRERDEGGCGCEGEDPGYLLAFLEGGGHCSDGSHEACKKEVAEEEINQSQEEQERVKAKGEGIRSP